MSNTIELPVKLDNEDQAKDLALELSSMHPYIEVIESNGEYFVDNEGTMVRVWERVVCRYEDGIKEEEE